MEDRLLQWANAAAAQAVNLHLYADQPKHIVFQKVADLIHSTIVLALMEEREVILTPREN